MLNQNSPFLAPRKATNTPTWEGNYLQAIAVMRQGAVDLNRLTLKRAPIPMTRTHVHFMTSSRNLDLVTDAMDALADTVGTLENLTVFYKLKGRDKDVEDLSAAANYLRIATAALGALSNRHAREAQR